MPRHCSLERQACGSCLLPAVLVARKYFMSRGILVVAAGAGSAAAVRPAASAIASAA